ncbi:TlpA family protein disulfide reductase [Sphingomonas morindae]|uniref:TlpA family protein disulfide reductase n=1 Tax=Sphingomonas morindae TaxID=1541170 RepID=A0ABY4XBI7_9SPHN|nr:TlpA disulfide reductase family protein [Sphingomonas morindae]USI74342.1 TlpA family protein disulfide reductase [Sphingomonas morindae]
MRSLIACLPLMAVLALVAGCDKAKPPAEQAAPTTTGPAPAAGPEGSHLDRSHKGMALPALPFAAPGGAPATLGAYRGKPVLLNLWATWCGPCIKELPTLDALAAHAPGGLAVVAISQDSGGDKQVAPFWRQKGYKALVPFTDSRMGLMTALQADVLPTTILFDARGKEVWRLTGGKDWTSREAAALLAEAR